MSIIEMEVRMHCGGCQRKIRKALSKLQGVDTIDIDMEMQKVTVSISGYDVDEMAVLSALRNTGKKAELWPHHPPPSYYYHNYNSIYYTYNHETHNQVQVQVQPGQGYVYSCEGQEASSPGPSSIMDHKATTLFSDENPHACSLM